MRPVVLRGRCCLWVANTLLPSAFFPVLLACMRLRTSPAVGSAVTGCSLTCSFPAHCGAIRLPSAALSSWKRCAGACQYCSWGVERRGQCVRQLTGHNTLHPSKPLLSSFTGMTWKLSGDVYWFPTCFIFACDQAQLAAIPAACL